MQGTARRDTLKENQKAQNCRSTSHTHTQSLKKETISPSTINIRKVSCHLKTNKLNNVLYIKTQSNKHKIRQITKWDFSNLHIKSGVFLVVQKS